ncbi:acetyl-CoA carboxylase biotin carboxylase subunit [Amorphus sp. 3PC139-8]
MLNRVFVANRGEIAVRIVKACHSLGIEAVVGFSEPDRGSLAAQIADRAVCIGPGPTAASYLSQGRLISAALGTGCDALHPGYGFLAENASFAELCGDNDLTFVGPTPENVKSMGNKLEARRLAQAYDIPLAAGSVRINDFSHAEAIADDIGMPLLFKAAAGGGGRGIRIVRDRAELRGAFEQAAAEAQAAFGDRALFMERYIENARHVEVQILADIQGNVVHLAERDCSLQRRYQKMVEEAPSVGLADDLRAEIHAAAVRLTQKIGYVSAGTVEFIVDLDRGSFYFLEMNTRIQVEHPVTEMLTGVDIVAEQLRIAAGLPLSVKQEDVALGGHVIECRINAEAPARGFNPSPGRVMRWRPPTGDHIRLDTHAFEGWVISPYYDSLLGKLIVRGQDRPAAVERMSEALATFEIEGPETTLPFLSYVFDKPDFREGHFNTRWLEAIAPGFAADAA